MIITFKIINSYEKLCIAALVNKFNKDKTLLTKSNFPFINFNEFINFNIYAKFYLNSLTVQKLFKTTHTTKHDAVIECSKYL